LKVIPDVFMPVQGIYTKSGMRFANENDRREHRSDLRAIEAIKERALRGHALATGDERGSSRQRATCARSAEVTRQSPSTSNTAGARDARVDRRRASSVPRIAASPSSAGTHFG
jgi:hypothetical protein